MAVTLNRRQHHQPAHAQLTIYGPCYGVLLAGTVAPGVAEWQAASPSAPPPAGLQPPQLAAAQDLQAAQLLYAPLHHTHQVDTENLRALARLEQHLSGHCCIATCI